MCSASGKGRGGCQKGGCWMGKGRDSRRRVTTRQLAVITENMPKRACLGVRQVREGRWCCRRVVGNVMGLQRTG